MRSTKSNYKGLWSKTYWTDTKSGQDVYVIFAQGAGESTRDPLNGSDLDSFINRHSYGKYAENRDFGFNVMTIAWVYNGNPTPDQAPAANYLTEYLDKLGAKVRILCGHSYGSGFANGMAFYSLNSGKTVSRFKGGEKFDGFVAADGGPPGTPNYAFQDKPWVGIYGTNGYDVRSMQKVYEALTDLQAKGLRKSFTKQYVIPNGSHGDSSSKGFNPSDPYGAQILQDINKMIEIAKAAQIPTPVPDPVPDPVKEIVVESVILVGNDLIANLADGTKLKLSYER